MATEAPARPSSPTGPRRVTTSDPEVANDLISRRYSRFRPAGTSGDAPFSFGLTWTTTSALAADRFEYDGHVVAEAEPVPALTVIRPWRAAAPCRPVAARSSGCCPAR
ncbi:hypothetical protein GCM10025868_02010 [Angustibacter aerolatus]|uniref:Uncharacterized protein n=1 Tax=Angustibacter aerolatus TaxID=1162965 RepID=A0ABQ6JDT9_9ACTN|nr:hypothetical protein [Angustibacter aerolatus]GMA84951.1 hypothetical protein GCM10025868_02010 [Angustibacter aerolatus]